MLARVLEPEVMDTPDEARDYDAMDFADVNARFVADLLAFHGPPRGGRWLDVGTGTARIPIQIALADPIARLLAVDLSRHMLELGRENVQAASLGDRVSLDLVDAKGLPYPDHSFEAVISNSIVHHIPEPAACLAEMTRLLAPGGSLFIRDLARPPDLRALELLVRQYAGDESDHGQAMFRDSLHAALTLHEVQALLEPLGVLPGYCSMTSDRHWTCAWRRPEIVS